MAWLLAAGMSLGPVQQGPAEDFSLSRCMATGSDAEPTRPPRADRGGPVPGPSVSREFACLKAQRDYEAKRQAKEAAERESQRRTEEEATKRQAEATAKETGEQPGREKSTARAERARKAGQAEGGHELEARQEAARAQRAAQQRRGTEQLLPGECATPDLTAKCAMRRDPVWSRSGGPGRVRRGQAESMNSGLSLGTRPRWLDI